MFKTSLVISILVSTLLIIPSCSKKEAELQGSVFIVTKGAQNIKLGLVKVTAIPENEINQFVEKKKATISSETSKLNKDIESIKPEVEKYQKEFNEAKKIYDEINNQKEGLKARERSLNSDFNPYSLYESPYLSEYETPEDKAERNKQKQIQKQIEGVKRQIAAFESKVSQANKVVSDAQQRLNDSRAKLSAVSEKIISFLNQGFLFDGLPEGKIKAVTDADGKFSLKLPAGKYALVASSQRRVVDTTEEYYWLVWVNADGQETKQIILSNQNLLGEDSEDSVFKYGELVPSLDNTNQNSNTKKFAV